MFLTLNSLVRVVIGLWFTGSTPDSPPAGWQANNGNFYRHHETENGNPRLCTVVFEPRVQRLIITVQDYLLEEDEVETRFLEARQRPTEPEYKRIKSNIRLNSLQTQCPGLEALLRSHQVTIIF